MVNPRGRVNTYHPAIDDVLTGAVLIMSAELILHTPVTRPHTAHTRHAPAADHIRHDECVIRGQSVCGII